MPAKRPSLTLLQETFAVCPLDKDEEIPSWAIAGDFFSITRTGEELSILCSESLIPEATKREAGWRCLKSSGPFDFSASGIIASMVAPLAKAGISILVVSTFSTDYLMVKEGDLKLTMRVLAEKDFEIEEQL